MKVQCDGCPAKNRRVRFVEYAGRKIHLCPLCIKAAQRLYKRPADHEAQELVADLCPQCEHATHAPGECLPSCSCGKPVTIYAPAASAAGN